MGATDFDSFFLRRVEALVGLVEQATGKRVQRDLDTADPAETPDHFDTGDAAVVPDEGE